MTAVGTWRFHGQLLSPGTGTDSFKAGPDAIAAAANAIAIGHDAQVDASGLGGVAVGRQSFVGLTQRGVAVGEFAWTQGDSGASLGWSAEVDSNYGSALGPYTYVEAGSDSATAVGDSAFIDTNSPYGTAVGTYAEVGKDATSAISIGDSSSVERYNEGGIAIGYNSFAGINFGSGPPGSIAIGDNANAQGLGVSIGHDSSIPLNGIDNFNDASVAIGFLVRAGANGVHIGSQMSHTGAKDAVAIGQFAGGNEQRYVSVGWAAWSSTDSVSVGYDCRAGIEGVAVGVRADPSTGSVAIGYESDASRTGDIAIGYQSSAINFGGEVGDLASVMIGRECKSITGGLDLKRDACVGLGAVAEIWSKWGTAIGTGSVVAVDSIGSTAVGYKAQAGDHGTAATGAINAIAGSLLVDGETYILNDGVNPAVTFEFDSDYSVVETSTLRRSLFASGNTAIQIATNIANAINLAPVLNMLADNSGGTSATVTITNTNSPDNRAAGNIAITETVTDAGFTVSGMSGGVDATVTPDAVAVGETSLALAAQAIAIGKDAQVDTSGAGGVAIGRQSFVGLTQRGVAVGEYAWTQGDSGCSVGWSAEVDSDYGSALGPYTYVEAGSDSATAVGDSAFIDTNSPYGTAVGTYATVNKDATSAIAMGDSAEVERYNEGGIAIGYNSFAGINFGSGPPGSIAIGDNANAQGLGVSIGHDSSIPLNGIDNFNDASVAIGFSVSAGANSVCIGSQMSNSSAKDAVSIGQFAGASNRCVSIGWAASNEPDCVSIGYDVKAGSEGVAIGTRAEPATRGVALGYEADANRTGDVAIGYQALAINFSGASDDLPSVMIGRECKSITGGADLKRDACVGIGAVAEIWSKWGTVVGADALVAVDSIGSVAVGYRSQAGDHGTAATGTINSIAGNLIGEGETFVLGDGINSAVTFEFDSDSSVIETNTLRAVPRNDSFTAVQQATWIAFAINAAPVLNMEADNAGGTSATVTITNTNPPDNRAVGNVTITETVTNAGFTVSGMSGGVDAAVTPGAVAIGNVATVLGTQGVGIGDSVSVSGSASVAIGYAASTSYGASVSVGDTSSCTGVSAVAVGGDASSAAQGVAIGRVAEAHSSAGIAVGYQSDVAAADGIAIGRSAGVTVNGTEGIAIGYQASAGYAQSAAIGRSSSATAANRMTVGQVGGSYYMDLQVSRGFAAFGVSPPTTQPVKINDPTDLASALTAIAALIDVVEGTGLSASA